MFSLTKHNKLVLSVALFWVTLGLTITALAFLGYRVSTDLPGSSWSGVGVFARFAVLVVLAAMSAIGTRELYKSAGKTPSFMDTVTTTHDDEDGHEENPSQIASTEPAPAEPDTPKPKEPTPAEKLPAPKISEIPGAREQDELYGRHAESPLLQRIHKIMLQNYNGTAILLQDESVYRSDEDKDPAEFTIRAARDGGFSDTHLIDKIFKAVTKSIPKGTILWNMDEKTTNDRLIFEKKRPFKKQLFPDIPEFIAQNTDEASADYKTKKFTVGEDAFGEKIQIDPKKSPHGLVIGGTGSGKSVFTLGLIEDLRVSGWQIVIVDGKKTDYISLIKTPNVIAVGSKVEDWVRLTQFVNQQMEARYAESQRRQIAGDDNRFPEPPMLFLLDEFGSVVRDIESRYGKAGYRTFFSILQNIAAKARQAKIHMVIATQDLYADTFPGNFKANLKFIVSLGKASKRTMQDAFSEEVRPKAVRIGQSIQDEDRGRGIIEIGTDDGKSVAEFQSYYAYSPGAPMEKGNAGKEWKKYKEAASDKVPRLYPRMWYEEPEPDELAAVDSVEVMENYPMINLMNRRFEIKDSRRMYDQLDMSYVGNQVSAGKLLGFDDDDDEETVPTPDDKWQDSKLGDLDKDAYSSPVAAFNMVDLYEGGENEK